MKRILAIIIAVFLTLSTFVPFVFADYSSQPVTFWDKYLYQWSHQGDGLGLSLGPLSIPLDRIGTLACHLSSQLCASSDDHLHHADSIQQGTYRTDSDGHGCVACTCKFCGHDFVYRSDDLQQDFNNYIHSSNLDEGPITPDTVQFGPFRLVAASNRIKYPNELYNGYPWWVGNIGKFRGYAVNLNLYASGDFSHTYFYKTSDTTVSFISNSSDEFRFYLFRNDSEGTYVLGGGCCFYPIGSSSYYYGFPAFQDGFDSVNLPLVDRSSLLNYIESTQNVTPERIVPLQITIDDRDYTIIDVDFSKREIHVEEDNRTIIYDDDKIIIKEGDTIIEENNYYIEDDDDPGTDPGNGDDSSTPTDPGTDPGNGDDSSTPTDPGTVDPGDASGSGGSGCCEQCAFLLRQVNSYLLQIQNLVDQINDKLGPESDNYMEGIYNLLVEINTALDNLPTEPHTDYESKLNTICNQLANIWGDLETIKTSLSAVQTNTATTNQKLDTVHADLQAVLSELQTQRGILSQILSVLQDMLGHITSIDSNVEELANEEDSQSFFDSFILKFHFIGDIFSIIRQLFADITNDAATVTFVDNGDLPIGDLTSQHFPVSGSPVPVGTAPEIMIRFPSDTYHGADLSGYSAIDMSWYAPYKSRVDALISGFLWIGYLWLLFKRAPGIVRGAAMIEETNYKIEDWKNGG